MSIHVIDNNKAKVTKLCTVCNRHASVVVDLMGYYVWRRGSALIQNALPELSPAEREILITGTHPACWTKLFSRREY